MASAPPILITPNFLLPSSTATCDYRCVVNALGTAVIFERSVLKSDGDFGSPQLYLLDLTQSGTTPSSFIGDQNIEISDRPDWCWRTGQVAFNFGPDIWVGVVDSSGGNFRSLGAQTASMNYPTWFPNGKTLAVENYAASSQPNPGPSYPLPNTTTIDSSTGVPVTPDLEGLDLWAGMPSVNPVNPNLIVFAGQPVSGSTYNQDMNYIYLMDTSSSEGPSPLESAALGPGSFNPNYQGRAPWWSPDGKWVVFESNRPSQYEANGLYAIYLYEYLGSGPAIQITSTVYNCNHAKWFPNGFSGGPAGAFQLIVASWIGSQSDPPTGPYGLSSLDLTPLGITF
jgi:Tol biopolymer transport system component